MTGLWALLAALLATALIAVALRSVNGRFRETAAPVAAGPAEGVEFVTADEIGGPLGHDVTLLQFSSAFCAPCRATRTLLADVASRADGVRHVEVDAESHLDLVRRLGVLRTPTVLVLDSDGVVVRRASGLPRREQVEAAIGLASRHAS